VDHDVGCAKHRPTRSVETETITANVTLDEHDPTSSHVRKRIPTELGSESIEAAVAKQLSTETLLGARRTTASNQDRNTSLR